MSYRARIDELELMLFWATRGYLSFKRTMGEFNQMYSSCNCRGCVEQGRCTIEERVRADAARFAAGLDYDYSPDASFDPNCTFAPAFDKVLADFGMVVVSMHDQPGGIEAPKVQPDAHFLTRRPSDWSSWRFGPRLLNAKTIRDPELKRYMRLIEEIECCEPWSLDQEVMGALHCNFVTDAAIWPYRKRSLSEASKESNRLMFE